MASLAKPLKDGESSRQGAVVGHELHVISERDSNDIHDRFTRAIFANARARTCVIPARQYLSWIPVFFSNAALTASNVKVSMVVSKMTLPPSFFAASIDLAS